MIPARTQLVERHGLRGDRSSRDGGVTSVRRQHTRGGRHQKPVTAAALVLAPDEHFHAELVRRWGTTHASQDITIGMLIDCGIGLPLLQSYRIAKLGKR